LIKKTNVPFGASVWNNKKGNGIHLFPVKRDGKGGWEFALSCLACNIERAKNLLGFEKMMELMAGA
jgi:hypothetical protein